MLSLEGHRQWPAVLQIYKGLKAAGFEALIAGGAVRDALLGRDPVDIDIATNATPEQVDQIFEKTVLVGAQFGVCRVVIDEEVVEVATFRTDGDYKDGRRPESVEFSTPKKDALRRDFTINAMFLDIDDEEVLDYVGGKEDLKKGVIRTVGEPEQRFAEDKLRILRALRFLAQLEFPLEKKTALAIKKFAPQIGQVSQERIRDEWERLLMSPGRRAAIELSHTLGLWDPLFGGWEYNQEMYDEVLADHSLKYDEIWALWFLMHWKSEPMALKMKMEKWKLPKDLIHKTQWVAKNWEALGNITEMEDVDVALFIGQKDAFFGVELYPVIEYNRDLKAWAESLGRAESFFEKGQLPKPKVTGDDLLNEGFKQGPELAKELKKRYRQQLLDKK